MLLWFHSHIPDWLWVRLPMFVRIPLTDAWMRANGIAPFDDWEATP